MLFLKRPWLQFHLLPFPPSLPIHSRSTPHRTFICPTTSNSGPRRAATGQPSTTGTIPSSHPFRPNTIPLRTLTPSQPADSHSASLLVESDEKHGGRHSSDTADSDFDSLWSDTGDLAEQLADEEDPLQIKLRESQDDPDDRLSTSALRTRPPRRVRYAQQDHLQRKNTNPGVDKEAIEIPEPAPRKITNAEKAIATIMTGDRQGSQMHGLTGKPLLYATLLSLTTVFAC